MTKSNDLRFSNSVLLVPMLSILLIWTVYWAELELGVNLNYLGVYPRRFSGLIGVVSSPFIHSSLEHLYNNSIPLAILTASLFYFYRSSALRVLFLGWLLSGLLTWCIGRPSYHIGASGLIYLLASFIFFKGIFTKHYRLVALSLAVVFIYGGLLWYIFPVEDGISWEGHLSGFLAGLLLAKIIKVRVPEQRKYSWEASNYNEEDDAFLKCFDEHGNFIEQPNESNISEEPEVTYRYIIKPSKED